MKIHAHWQRHVEAWRGSGLSQADYCRQQNLNRKTFSLWTRRVQEDLSMSKDDSPLELISVQVTPSAQAVTAETSPILLRFPHGAQLELSTAASPHWLAELLRCLA
jgi:hypothetical protein